MIGDLASGVPDGTAGGVDHRAGGGAVSDGSPATVNEVTGSVRGGSVVQARDVNTLTVNHYVPPRAPELDAVTDTLAVAMWNQWEDAANDRRLLQPHPLPIRWRRCTDPVAGPETAAGMPRDGDAPLAALPGLHHAGSLALQEGDRRALHRVYGGLPSGRLLLVGGPGSGKSSAAVLLLLDALRYRDQAPDPDRYRIPVPVMFTLAGWDPDTTPVRDWLTTKLATDIRLFRGRRGKDRATELLRAGRITVFLDGLDEIPAPLRPRALQALSEQATFRLVLLTRTHELAAAAHHHILIGALALELLPLRPIDAADYLLRPLTEPAPPAWQAVTTTLSSAPDSPLGQALATPLAVGLLRDVYPPTAPVDELLDATRFPTPNAITDHLLDHAITAAYTPRPGQPPPRYTSDTAHHTLTLIAQHLRDTNTRDFAWWTIPTWIPRTPRMLISALLGTCVTEIAWFAGANSFSGFAIAAGGLGAGLMAEVVGVNTPMAVRTSRWSQVRWGQTLKVGFKVGFKVGLGAVLVLGLALGLALGLKAGLKAGLALGLVFAPPAGLAAGLLFALSSQGTSETVRPTDVWRGAVIHGLLAGLVFGLVVVVGLGLVFGLAAGLSRAPLALALMFMLLEPHKAVVSQIYLRIKHHTPLRLGRFLQDAHKRHLLRTVGPFYQFRHATLQDRLAPPHPESAAPTETSRANTAAYRQ